MSERYVAKRDHKQRCTACGDPILKGDAVARWFFQSEDDGLWRLQFAHIPCEEAVNQLGLGDWQKGHAFNDRDDLLALVRAAVTLARIATGAPV